MDGHGFLDEINQIVGVKVTNPEDIRPAPVMPKRVWTTFRTFSLSNASDPVQILSDTPNRTRALIQVTTAGPVIFGESRSAVMKGDNGVAQVNVAAAGIIELKGNGEVWAWSTVAGVTNCAVIAEFCGE